MIQKTALIILALISSLAHSQLINTSRPFWRNLRSKMGISQDFSMKLVEGSYVLYGSSQDKERIIGELERWSGKSARGSYSLKSPIVVDSILPDSVAQNIFTTYLYPLANCHNNSLITAGLMERRMGVGNSEFLKHLELFCEEIPVYEPGAIGVQYGPGTRTAVHSYTVVGDMMTFEKVDVQGDKPPKFKRFVDSRKSDDIFYKCKKRKLKSSCSTSAINFGKEVDELHRKTSELIRRSANISKRDEFLQKAYELEAKVFLDGSCPEYQELMEARINSIIDTYLQIQTTGVYGPGTYDLGPRI